jgi:signal transduction histidine kinase
VWAIAGVAAAAIGAFALPLAVVVQRTYRDDALLRLQRDTVAATRQVDVAPGAGDPVELPPSTDRIAVYDLQGRRIAGRGPARSDSLTAESLRRSRPVSAQRGGKLVAAAALITSEQASGALRAERDDDELQARIRRTWGVLAAIAAGLLLAAWLAARVLAIRLAGPVESLADAARRLGDGDFTARASRSGIREPDAVAEALDQTAERLQQLLDHERTFAADASHQLRTPLAALRLELEGFQLEHPAAPGLDSAVAQADRLQQTIDTLLAVRRDIPGLARRARVEPRLAALEERWRGRLAARGRPLHVRDPGAPDVAIAPVVLDEILDVLLSNAERHGEGAVTVATERLGDRWLELQVGDEGPGFGGDAERAFLRRSPDASGHGIGLALARSLAEAEGGRLTVTRAGARPVVTLFLEVADARTP